MTLVVVFVLGVVIILFHLLKKIKKNRKKSIDKAFQVWYTNIPRR